MCDISWIVCDSKEVDVLEFESMMHLRGLIFRPMELRVDLVCIRSCSISNWELLGMVMSYN